MDYTQVLFSQFKFTEGGIFKQFLMKCRYGVVTADKIPLYVKGKYLFCIRGKDISKTDLTLWHILKHVHLF